MGKRSFKRMTTGKRHCLMKMKRSKNRLSRRIKRRVKRRKLNKMTNYLGRKKGRKRGRRRRHIWMRWIHWRILKRPGKW